ncbi:MAG: hypothetical protein AAFR54_05310 [Planctomycetota bacterium]
MTPSDEAPLASEDELHELFRRRRPDPDAFRASIEERVRAARADDGAKANGSRWKSAAAGVPLVIHAGAKAGGLKGLPAILLWPAALVAAAVGVFAFGARTVRDSAAAAEVESQGGRRRRSTAPGRSSSALDRGLGRESAIVWLVFLGLTLLGPSRFGPDLTILFLLTTMLSVSYGVRRLARTGALFRSHVARVVYVLMGLPMFQLLVQGQSFGPTVPASDLGLGPSVAVLVAGAVVVQWLARTPLAWGVVLLFVFSFGFLNTAGVTHSSASGVRSTLDDVRLDPEDLSGWDGAAAGHRALRAVGAETPDFTSVAAALRDALERGADVHPAVWTAAFDMELLGAEEIARLAAASSIAPPTEREIERGLVVNPTHYYLFRLLTLLEAETLTGTQRAALVDTYASKWPEPGIHDPLTRARFVVRALDALGESERADARRTAVHDLLVEHWMPASRAKVLGQAGGFTSNPVKFRTSFEDTTLAAVELMARFGVPEGIELRQVRSFLRGNARAFPAVFEFHPYLHLEARAGLLRLREEIGLPKRSLAGALVQERFFLTMLLCAALAVFAVASAPRDEGGGGVGAQP